MTPPIDILQIAHDLCEEARLSVVIAGAFPGTANQTRAYNAALLRLHAARDDLDRARDLVWALQDANEGGFW